MHLPLSILDSDEEDKGTDNNEQDPGVKEAVPVRRSRFFTKVSTPVAIDVSHLRCTHNGCTFVYIHMLQLVSPDPPIPTLASPETKNASPCRTQHQSSDDDTPTPLFKRRRRIRRAMYSVISFM